jgi:hypothetical protein
MKTTLKKCFLCAASIGWATMALVTTTQAQANITGNKHNVRIMRNQDGSFTEFKKSSDERIIERRNYSAQNGGSGERVLRMSIIYRKDVYGKMRSGRIHDGSGKILYRVVYGYHKETGKLVAENMFDARVKRTEIVTDPSTGKTKEVEKPVRKLYHRYDAQGRRAKPIVICLPPGKRAEELFGPDKGSWIKDPFDK